MADLQKCFRKFHDTIAVKADEEKAILAEKRDRILKRLAKGLEAQRATGAHIPAYRTLNQGSYPMGTGVKPVDGDFDLDVAILFDMEASDCPDPVKAKTWVHDAIDGHTKEVRIREPCVTVFYQQDGEHAYHVDFAVYADKGSEAPKLSRGKPNSNPAAKRWEPSDPEALLALARRRFADFDDGGQCRRVIRGLKRWKDVAFPVDGHAAPRGIAITAAAFEWFTPAMHRDVVTNTTRFDDARAMCDLVGTMLSAFRPGAAGPRLSVKLPVAPGNDLFGKMTDAQMSAFHDRLRKLHDGLTAALADPDPVTAATTVSRLLGSDFPVPELSETAEPRAPAIVSSGHSA